MSRAVRYALLNRLRRELRALGLTDRAIADLIVDAAQKKQLIDSTKYLTGQQLDLLCRPTSGKSVNKWVILGAHDVFVRHKLVPTTEVERAAFLECIELGSEEPVSERHPN